MASHIASLSNRRLKQLGNGLWKERSERRLFLLLGFITVRITLK